MATKIVYPLLMSIANWIFTIIFILNLNFVSAQNIHQNTAWLSAKTSIKISKRTAFDLDFLLRSSDNYTNVKNILVRPGFSYDLNKNFKSTIGYVLSITKQGEGSILKNHLTEQRIWEQLEYKSKVEALTFNSRVRLEQRFIQKVSENIFSQRLRLMSKLIIFLDNKGEKSLLNGFYTGLQEELFFNVENKDKINAHFFEQNRGQIMLGYKLDSNMELEMAYVNQYIKGINNHTINNIAQFTVNTRF